MLISFIFSYSENFSSWFTLFFFILEHDPSARDEVRRVNFIDPWLSMPRLGIGGGRTRWDLGHVRLVVAGAALRVHPLRHGVSGRVSPPVHGGYPDSVPCGGRALALRGGERGTVVSGDVEEGVEEEVSAALPQGGRLHEGGGLDVLGGAGGVEA